MGITDKVVLIGGNIPQKDISALKDYGVDEVFPVGTKLDDIVGYIRKRTGTDDEKR
jgi:methylmalonyl-CoA mutase C-terminal domain/subunit